MSEVSAWEWSRYSMEACEETTQLKIQTLGGKTLVCSAESWDRQQQVIWLIHDLSPPPEQASARIKRLTRFSHLSLIICRRSRSDPGNPVKRHCRGSEPPPGPNTTVTPLTCISKPKVSSSFFSRITTFLQKKRFIRKHVLLNQKQNRKLKKESDLMIVFGIFLRRLFFQFKTCPQIWWCHQMSSFLSMLQVKNTYL